MGISDAKTSSNSTAVAAPATEARAAASAAPGRPTAARRAAPLFSLGRPFLHPLFDYMMIGGGLSLVTAAIVWLVAGRGGSGVGGIDGYMATSFPALILLSNSAHFAASSVRLYTKPGAFRALPFLTMGFPLVMLAATTLTIVFADFIGRHFNNLYLAWSPFHYSAQAYGLAMMYCYRSGCQLTEPQRKWLRWSCLATFFYALFGNRRAGTGIWWVLPWEWAESHAWFYHALMGSMHALSVLAVAMPLAGFAWLQWRGKAPMPLISLLIVMTNAMWFVLFPHIDAVAWSTVFHGVQYLSIVMIFHVKDHAGPAGHGRARAYAYHAAVFYALCVAIGYALFQCWPSAYAMMGLKYSQSVLMVAAAINIHHFIVDAYIWKLRKDPNYKIVTEALPA